MKNFSRAGGDNGGTCKGFCKDLNPSRDWPGDSCHGLSWPPKNVGKYLEITAAYSVKWRRGTYNEFIVDHERWLARVPETVEAMFGARGTPLQHAAQVHREFLTQHPGLSASTHPLLQFNEKDWSEPFSAVNLRN